MNEDQNSEAESEVIYPRIGHGLVWMGAGGGLAVLGFFLMLAGARQEFAAILVPFGQFFIGLGVLGAILGFWIRLFGLLERRLMDIQAALTGKRVAIEDD